MLLFSITHLLYEHSLPSWSREPLVCQSLRRVQLSSPGKASRTVSASTSNCFTLSLGACSCLLHITRDTPPVCPNAFTFDQAPSPFFLHNAHRTISDTCCAPSMSLRNIKQERIEDLTSTDELSRPLTPPRQLVPSSRAVTISPIASSEPSKLHKPHSHLDNTILATMEPQSQRAPQRPQMPSSGGTHLAHSSDARGRESRATTILDPDVDMEGNAVNGVSGLSLQGDGRFTILAFSTRQRTDHNLDNRSQRSVTMDAMYTLGQHSRELISAIQKLSTLNINATLPSLPKFVVVGDQSAGKSSIVEAVCNITVPRDQGTCTRCPFQITTTAKEQGAPWKCELSLQSRYAYQPNARGGRDGYDGWVEQEIKVFHFGTFHDKNSLEEALRRAQLAILNPQVTPELYQNASATRSKATKINFSPNVVRMDIEGPDLPELSFFDLPGAINVDQDGNQKIVEFIEKLIKHYLRDEKALILLACSADQDVNNSTTFRFVSQCKAKDRCMGVLTKPDLVSSSRYHLIEQVLKNDAAGFQLGHMWYVTKQLSQDELMSGTVSHADARAIEYNFFRNTPWSDHLVEHFDRFGITALQSQISHELTKHILAELPEIMERVHDRLHTVTLELATFPEKPQSAAHTVLDEIQRLTTLITRHIKGEGEKNEFKTKYRGYVRDLRTHLKAARPEVILSTPGHQKPTYTIDEGEDEEEEEEVTPVPTPSKRARGGNGQPITPAKRAMSRAAETPRSVSRVRFEPTATVAATKLTLRLDELHGIFEQFSSSDIPGSVDPKAIQHLIKLSTKGWRVIVQSILSKVKDLVDAMFAGSIDDALPSRRNTQFETETRNSVQRLATSTWAAAYKDIMHVIDCETFKGVTFSGELRVEEIRVAALRNRHIERINEYFDRLELRSENSKVFSAADRAKKFDDEAMRTKLGADQYSREVDALGQPLAYYDWASARMLDTVASHLDFMVLTSLEATVHGALRADLRATDEDYCQMLLAEDPEREVMRAKRLAEQRELEAAMEELRRVESLPR